MSGTFAFRSLVIGAVCLEVVTAAMMRRELERGDETFACILYNEHNSKYNVTLPMAPSRRHLTGSSVTHTQKIHIVFGTCVNPVVFEDAMSSEKVVQNDLSFHKNLRRLMSMITSVTYY